MDALRNNYKKLITLRIAKKIVILILTVFLFDFFLFPAPVLANNGFGATDKIMKISDKLVRLEVNKGVNAINNFPAEKEMAVARSSYHIITAYTSEVGQTDDSPCITANGFNLCEHGKEDSLASNFLPFGAKVRVPDLFGDRVFTIRDRMNARYSNRLDIWMADKANAKTFGVKRVKIEVLE